MYMKDWVDEMKKIIIFIVIIVFIISTIATGYFIYMQLDTNTAKVENKNNKKRTDYKTQNNQKDIITNEESDSVQEEVEPSETIDYKYKKLDYILGDKEVIGKTDNGYTIELVNGVTYIDGIMMVNKTYPLPSDYIPLDTYESAFNRTNTCNTCINKIAYNAFLDMKADALTLGLNLKLSSGYRPYSTQKTIYNNYIARDGKTAADTYSARPGYSEHQSGLCFDLNSISDSFANTNEGKWINENAYKYGFTIRFPKGKDEYTGYKYESWHLRYVGEELATTLYNDGNWLSMEEYFGIKSEYQN